MSDAQLRVSDTERDRAVAQLGQHHNEGRLTDDEFGTRAAAVIAARTRAEVRELFADLPQPHPWPPAGSQPSQEQPSQERPWAPADRAGSPSAPEQPWPTLESGRPHPQPNPSTGFPSNQPSPDGMLSPTGSNPALSASPPTGKTQQPPQWLNYAWIGVPIAIFLTMWMNGRLWFLIPLAVVAVIYLNKRYKR